MKNEEYKILPEENYNKVKNIFRDLPSLIGHITDSYERYFSWNNSWNNYYKYYLNK